MTSRLQLTVGVFGLNSFGFLHKHSEHNNFRLLLSGHVHQSIMSFGWHAERTLCMQIHLFFVVSKLCTAKRPRSKSERKVFRFCVWLTKAKSARDINLLGRQALEHRPNLQSCTARRHTIVPFRLVCRQFLHRRVDLVRFRAMSRHVFRLHERPTFDDSPVSMRAPWNFRNTSHQYLGRCEWEQTKRMQL